MKWWFFVFILLVGLLLFVSESRIVDTPLSRQEMIDKLLDEKEEFSLLPPFPFYQNFTRTRFFYGITNTGDESLCYYPTFSCGDCPFSQNVTSFDSQECGLTFDTLPSILIEVNATWAIQVGLETREIIARECTLFVWKGEPTEGVCQGDPDFSDLQPHGSGTFR